MLLQVREEIVQGPLDHPSLGKTIVVRPTVEAGRVGRMPSQAVVVTAVARRLIELSRLGERIQAVLVEGDKDPTTHPEFHEISENVRELLDKWFPKALLCLQSDAPELSRAQTRHALSFYDRPILRLDAGTQKTFAALTGGQPRTFKDLVENMSQLQVQRLIVHGRFVRGDVDNSSDAEVRAWIKVLAEIRPSGVHISTGPRPNGRKDRPIPKTRMAEIAALVTERTGIPVEVAAS